LLVITTEHATNALQADISYPVLVAVTVTSGNAELTHHPGVYLGSPGRVVIGIQVAAAAAAGYIYLIQEESLFLPHQEPYCAVTVS
jgi:hypothetical protein